jgi:hypothetical protein
MSSTDSSSISSSSSSSSSSKALPLDPDLAGLPFSSFLDDFGAGPVEPLVALVFFETALTFPALDAGVALEVFLEVLAAVFTGLVAALAFAAGLAILVALAGALAADFVVLEAFLILGTLLEPARRVFFFGATGAFATGSSRLGLIPGITKTHVKSEKNPSDWVFLYYATDMGTK